MDSDVDRALRGLEAAAEFAKTYQFEITDDYLALIAQVEALPPNAPLADKSWVWRLIDSAGRHYARAVRVR